MSSQKEDDPPMRRRRTTMSDGRYMYYYTFGDEATGEAGSDASADGAEQSDV